MIYILIFLFCCYLDWKLDTYAFMKVLIAPVLIMIAIFAGMFYYEPKIILKPSNQEQTFITSDITKRSFKSDITEFSYTTESGIMGIESNDILEIKEGKENKLVSYNRIYPKNAKILFFFQNQTKYKVYLK